MESGTQGDIEGILAGLADLLRGGSGVRTLPAETSPATPSQAGSDTDELIRGLDELLK